MKNFSVKYKNRIEGIKPILILSAVFASLTLFLLREFSPVSMIRPSSVYGRDAFVNPFGKLSNDLNAVLLQIIVHIALTIIGLISILLFVYAICYVMRKIIALISDGFNVIAKVKYSSFDEVLINSAQPTFDCASLLTCKNLN